MEADTSKAIKMHGQKMLKVADISLRPISFCCAFHSAMVGARRVDVVKTCDLCLPLSRACSARGGSCSSTQPTELPAGDVAGAGRGGDKRRYNDCDDDDGIGGKRN